MKYPAIQSFTLALFFGMILGASGTTFYVNVNNSTPAPPYTAWDSAAVNIQDAVDLAVIGDVVLVTNGVYSSGGGVVSGSLVSRVVVNKAITVQSVNGPAVTLILGGQNPGTTNGDGATRCVYLTNNAMLVGFTLTNGATRVLGGTTEKSGGGVYCRSTTAVVSNCVIIGNAASVSGGGAFQGTLLNCTLVGNTATNGAGASSSLLKNSVLSSNLALASGGGAYNSSLTNCLLIGNSAAASGGGAYSGTLTNCSVMKNAAGSGGGISVATALNCLLRENSAVTNGGGAYGGALRSCGLAFNSASYGAGVSQVSATNCTLTANAALGYGGGSEAGTLNNCILFYNTAAVYPNYNGGTLNYCCTTPLPFGSGNIIFDPRLLSPFRIAPDSTCRGAGNPIYARGTDLDNEPWLNPPSIGSDEFYSGTSNGLGIPPSAVIQTTYTNVATATALRFLADISAPVVSNFWTFGDGMFASNRFEVFHSWATPGSYIVSLTAYSPSYPGGISATQLVHVVSQPVAYVSKASPNPVSPYASWATAATNIQDAIDISTVPGGLVLVSNGVYNSGSTRTVGALLSNRVSVSRSLTLRSVNGPAVTVIEGAQDAGTTNGPGAIRCVFLSDSCSLIGFTLTNGATRNSNSGLDQSGGGVWCAPSATVSNCVITGNSANFSAGGVYSGQLFYCTLAGNFATNGGAADSAVLTNCTLTGNSATQGGAANNSFLFNCTLDGNNASTGGGAAASTLSGCLLSRNVAAVGGGAQGSTLSGCTVSNNTAYSASGFPGGGGTASCLLTNCILSANVSSANSGGAGGGILDHCTVTNNSAATMGGGISSATVIHCSVFSNSAGTDGGGVYACNVTDSSVIGNRATTGGGANSGTLTNCILSLNAATNGGGAYGGNLYYCTLAGNSAVNLGGGGSSTTLNNCVVTNNTALMGGGVDSSTVNNSLLAGNTVLLAGGGQYYSTLNNCTLIANSSAQYGGGAYNGYLNNSIAFYNFAGIGSNYYGTMVTYSCSSPLAYGVGNIDADPQLAGFFRLASTSPCRAAGTNLYNSGKDLDGQPWLNPPSMGCDEFYSGASGALTVAIDALYTNMVVGFPAPFSALITGNVSAAVWEVNGSVTSNRPAISSAWNFPGDYPVVLRAYNDNNPGGISATIMVHVVAQQIHYVALNSTTPTPPYTSWQTASTNIQNAIDVANVAGATVLVSNGVYQTGGRKVLGEITNRVAITKPVLLQSVNGPAATIILGFQSPGVTNGPGAVRCVYLTNGAAISGFTLTNGATLDTGYGLDQCGGGIWCPLPSAIITNCVLSGNNAATYGGGAWLGFLKNCTVTRNVAESGGGVYGGSLADSTISSNIALEGGGVNNCYLTNCIVTGNSAPIGEGGGGGAHCGMDYCVIAGNTAGRTAAGLLYGTLNNCSVLSNHLDIYDFLPQAGGTYFVDMTNCLVAWNFCAGQGGGVDRGTINNCTLMNNIAVVGGGGAISATLANCVVASNSAPYGAGAWACNLINSTIVENQGTNYGAGFINSTATNCIVYHNLLYGGSSTDTNYDSTCTLSYCCTTPMPTNGIGNFTNDPSLVNLSSGNFRLLPTSACINSGNNAVTPAGPDRDGKPRIAGGTVDIGAYELPSPSSILSYLWAQQYGLPVDGSADFADPDHDSSNNWQEWLAGTDPTNSLSVLKMFPPSRLPVGVAVSWQSVNTRTYFLQRSTNLLNQPAFSTLQSNILGQIGTTTFNDTTATNSARFFYRVGVQR